MSRQIFFVEAGNEFGCKNDAVWLAFAPLNGSAFLVTKEEMISLQHECNASSIPDENKSIGARALLHAPTRPIMRIPKSWEDVYDIDILLNFKCNFHCVYCYSAAGRSDTELKWETVKTYLDYLFSDQHPREKTYRIHFSGGGEPTLSFGLIRKITEHIEYKANLSKHRFQLGMVTNGSLLTYEIMDYVAKHKIELVVSFEILKRFQNAERGHYDDVAANIDQLLARHAKFSVRATLTRDSACFMPEMVEEIHNRFPLLTSITFDTVLSPDLFPLPEALDDYYNIFFDNFLKAWQLGQKYGINIGSPIALLLTFQRERTCFGKIVFTPEGRFSVCSRVSSPKEKLFDSFIYGEIDSNGGIKIDTDKFNQFLQESTIESNPACHDCFARWNCGGGCHLFYQSFSKEFHPVFCKFQKRGLKHLILKTIADQFFEKNGVSLFDHIRKLYLK